MLRSASLEVAFVPRVADQLPALGPDWHTVRHEYEEYMAFLRAKAEYASLCGWALPQRPENRPKSRVRGCSGRQKTV